ncbi:transglycosylase SLT domain-containing protein [Amycolatopsis sp. NPDC059021]|uniref:transglycosylase SLT domain-containing protein n=1 Tax=Amycolatopsis sp. NPDC059021 TaxID=3346704 RepID=UPI00366B7B18
MKVVRWVLVSAALLVAGCDGTPPKAAPPPATTSTPASSSAAPTSTNQDPARFAKQVVARAREAGVEAQLVMAILYNESYKPHDPDLERAWQKMKPDAAFGIANMHKAAYDETKKGRPFANREWQELPDDPDLAIQAAAWYLHDLAAQLPSAHQGQSTTDLLAVGYNAGPGTMKTIARGTKPGPQVQTYLDTLHGNWAKAGQAVAP